MRISHSRKKTDNLGQDAVCLLRQQIASHMLLDRTRPPGLFKTGICSPSYPGLIPGKGTKNTLSSPKLCCGYNTICPPGIKVYTSLKWATSQACGWCGAVNKGVKQQIMLQHMQPCEDWRERRGGGWGLGGGHYLLWWGFQKPICAVGGSLENVHVCVFIGEAAGVLTSPHTDLTFNLQYKQKTSDHQWTRWGMNVGAATKSLNNLWPRLTAAKHIENKAVTESYNIIKWSLCWAN